MAKFIILLTLVLQSVIGFCSGNPQSQVEMMANSTMEKFRSEFMFAEVNAELAANQDQFELRKELENDCRQKVREFRAGKPADALSNKMSFTMQMDQHGSMAQVNFTAKLMRCESGCSDGVCKAYPVVEREGQFQIQRLSEASL